MKFKAFDRVRCIESFEDILKGGDIYTIDKMLDGIGTYQLKEVDGYWSASRFQIVKLAKVTIDYGGGKRFNSGKARVELLVPEAMEAEAKVWAMGAEKYGEYNWQKGMKWTIVIGCLLRHIFAIMRGEDIDKESGQLHAAHIKCNASMLIYYHTHFKEGDDRDPSKVVDSE